jgi:HK97 family phage prohead protease
MEKRYFSEIRIVEADGKPVISGYAAVFDKLSEDMGGWREKIAKGAFTKTLASDDDIRALIDHDSSLILGRKKANTLSLREDDKGLFVEIVPPDTTVGRDILVSIRRGDITGMSFGFNTISDSWNMENGVNIRTLTETKLFDVSPVTYPAYPDTSVAVRSMEQWLKQSGNYYIQTMKMKLRIADAEAVA